MAGSEKIPLKKISNNLKSGPATVINKNPCSITGNPKPTTSPQYNTFLVFDNKNILEEYYFLDLTWLFARYDGRSIVQPLMSIDSTQTISVWTAYNSLTSPIKVTTDKYYALPIINASPQSWQTLVTSLEGLHRLNREILC